GYGDFKVRVGEAVVEELRPIREKYEKLIADKAYLEESYRAAAQVADRFAQRTLDKAMKKIGFIHR
ncbi:MAG: tryptophan--tRNA ligase, partial [Ruminococcus sp.]|nr:tryptophan--tRNA ligase [Ruminococcus sp.]